MKKRNQLRSFGKLFLICLLVPSIYYMLLSTNNHPVKITEEVDVSALLLNLTKKINEIAMHININEKLDNSRKMEEKDKAGKMEVKDNAREMEEKDNAGKREEKNYARKLEEKDNAGKITEKDNAGTMEEKDNAGKMEEKDNAGKKEEKDNAGKREEKNYARKLEEKDNAGNMEEKDNARKMEEKDNAGNMEEKDNAGNMEEIDNSGNMEEISNKEKVILLNNTREEANALEGEGKRHNFTAFTFEKGLIHKFHCPIERVEEDEWKGHFLEFNKSSPKMNVIPTAFEESPIGIAPAIPTKFIIEEAEYCTKRPQMKAIALVPSAVMNFERRSTTRQTWASASDELGVIFFVGNSKNQTENEILAKESQIYHDIVQGDFIDLYQFLVYKNLNAFHWLTNHCDNVKWVVHADDDALLNTKKFINFVNNYDYPNPVEYIYCSIQCDSNTVRSGCKCAVSEEMYPYTNYPIYCSGYLWFTSMENIKSLLAVTSLVKFLWIDDVYVTGLLAERANITRYGAKYLGIVDPNEIENVFGWMMSGIDRNEHWKIVEEFYLN